MFYNRTADHLPRSFRRKIYACTDYDLGSTCQRPADTDSGNRHLDGERRQLETCPYRTRYSRRALTLDSRLCASYCQRWQWGSGSRSIYTRLDPPHLRIGTGGTTARLSTLVPSGHPPATRAGSDRTGRDDRWSLQTAHSSGNGLALHRLVQA